MGNPSFLRWIFIFFLRKDSTTTCEKPVDVGWDLGDGGEAVRDVMFGLGFLGVGLDDEGEAVREVGLGFGLGNGGEKSMVRFGFGFAIGVGFGWRRGIV